MTVTSKRKQMKLTRPKETDSAMFKKVCGSEKINSKTCDHIIIIYLQFGHISENWTLHLDHIG